KRAVAFLGWRSGSWRQQPSQHRTRLRARPPVAWRVGNHQQPRVSPFIGPAQLPVPIALDARLETGRADHLQRVLEELVLHHAPRRTPATFSPGNTLRAISTASRRLTS